MLAVLSLCQVQWHMQQHVQKHFKGLSSSTVPYVARRRGKAWSRDSFGDNTSKQGAVFIFWSIRAGTGGSAETSMILRSPAAAANCKPTCLDAAGGGSVGDARTHAPPLGPPRSDQRVRPPEGEDERLPTMHAMNGDGRRPKSPQTNSRSEQAGGRWQVPALGSWTQWLGAESETMVARRGEAAKQKCPSRWVLARIPVDNLDPNATRLRINRDSPASLDILGLSQAGQRSRAKVRQASKQAGKQAARPGGTYASGGARRCNLVRRSRAECFEDPDRNKHEVHHGSGGGGRQPWRTDVAKATLVLTPVRVANTLITNGHAGGGVGGVGTATRPASRASDPPTRPRRSGRGRLASAID
ncbi:hypothetical protein PCL_12598 [Purpureocillium lilacinum]|uniref:Uncharacterized protein n=1 Tax=Purpureocillium lilacinum TaxID=33203 RepID=A0A2U3E9R2_PURLI|nr:hypothetical protein PCL_12598 [Purpureocillium lilacinum]